ncbi:MAG: hypothetical protein CL609_17120 [Anaerolineaceae bacterium]|nr:hypothetical protein [Anaerolineaceae bacterium]
MKKNNKMIIFGGGGHGRTLIELVQAMGSYDLVGIVDDHIPPETELLGVPVLGGQAVLTTLYQKGICLAVNGVGGIGNPSARWAVFESLQKIGFDFPTVVHPTAFVEKSAFLDAGVQVLAQTYIGTQVKVGFGSVINAGAVLSHDVQAGICTNFSPGALIAGNVVFGDFTQVGMGATVNLNLKIGANVRIGNGATVKKDVPDDTIVRAGTIWPKPQLSRIVNVDKKEI